jgi:hypothetical protein
MSTTTELALNPAFGGTPWSWEQLATWLSTYNTAKYTQRGGNISLYQGQTGGQVLGRNTTNPALSNFNQPSPEDLQLADALKVATELILNEADTLATEQTMKLGLSDQAGAFRPFCSSANDLVLLRGQLTGGFQQGYNFLHNRGYPDTRAADLICLVLGDMFTSFDPSTNYSIAASVLGFPTDYIITDPVWFIEPVFTPAQIASTLQQDASATWANNPAGSLSGALTAWAYHVGGEKIHLCFPVVAGGASVQSYIATVLDTYSSAQKGAILAEVGHNFDAIMLQVPGVAAAIMAYCQQQSATFGIPYGPADMINATPLTPTAKIFLSQSQYYNPFSCSPPRFGMEFASAILAGTSPWILGGGQQATYENQTSAYGLDTNFMDQVVKRWAVDMHGYLKNSPLPYGDTDEEITLLKPFADCYDPTGVN